MRWDGGLATTDKDRVKARYPQATAQMSRFVTPNGRWAIRVGPTTLGRGANASRAWEDAARKLK